MSNSIKRIWNLVSTVLVVLVVLCAVFLMGSRLLGYQVYTVISGSMEPKYSVGDLIYVQKIYTKDIATIKDKTQRNAAIREKATKVQGLIDSGEITVGDDITFVLNEDLVVATHQIVRIDEEKKQIYTKGIANEIEDSEPVLYENVIGVVKFHIPLLGYVSDFIQNPPGTYITITAAAVLLVLVFLPDSKKKKEPKEDIEPAADETLAENEKLKAELEALRSQLQESSTAPEDK